MEPVTLFKLAASHNTWLSERQLTIAANVANADTPNFRAQDVAPFLRQCRQRAHDHGDIRSEPLVAAGIGDGGGRGA